MSDFTTNYNSIQGWFDFSDIYSRIVGAQIVDGSKVVEVGSWLGKSAIFLANQIKEKGINADFYCVDIWEGTTGDSDIDKIIKMHGGSVYDIFLGNIEKCGVSDFIKPIKKDSVSASRKFKNNSLDFCFIDALHTYEAVKEDIKTWLPKVKPGKYIGGHDADRECVQRALNEVLGNNWYRDSERSWLYAK